MGVFFPGTESFLAGDLLSSSVYTTSSPGGAYKFGLGGLDVHVPILMQLL